MSASYGGISLLEYDTEKVCMLGADEYDGGEKLTLGDVSGMLPDYKVSDYSSSPTSSSASSDTESVGGEEGEAEIVSPLHRASIHIPVPTTTTPPRLVRDASDTV
jgi:hypothetical protein